MSQREAALAARVAELEAAAERRAARAGGNVFEQVWQYIRLFLPWWIIVAGLFIFCGFQIVEYYQHGQREASITRLKEAQLALKDADAVAQRMIVNGQPARVERLRREVELKQKQAQQAKIEADASNAQVDGMTARLRAVQLEVANKQVAAKQAQLEAAAKWDKQPDGRTLEDHMAEAKEIQAELTAISAKWGAAIMGSRTMAIDALCDNRFAKAFGCPSFYVPPRPRDQQR